MANIIADYDARYHQISEDFGKHLELADKTTSKTSDATPHFSSWLPLSKVGTPSPYVPTFHFDGSYVNVNHEHYSTCAMGREGVPFLIDVGIDGFLQRDDALKIYELAYFSKGDILELGTHKGLSTSIIAQAMHDSGSSNVLDTVDIDQEANQSAQATMRDRPGNHKVRFHVCDATKFMERKIDEKKTYSFIFVDHWHGYKSTWEAAERAKALLEPGGFVFFHDFNDPDIRDPLHRHRVYQAVVDSMIGDTNFEFYGIFGCCSLFRRVI